MNNTDPKPAVIHGLHLATDDTVSTAWEQFFAACWDWYEVILQRRAQAKENIIEDEPCSESATPK